MKEDERLLLRGRQGPQGPQGLSAYGVWLAEGNVGTAEDFLISLKIGGRFGLAMHTGGQTVGANQVVALEKKATRGMEWEDSALVIAKPGSYFVRYFAAVGHGVFALKVNGLEAGGTRFEAQGAAFAVTAIDVAEAPVKVNLANVMPRPVRLSGNSGAVDAYIHITSI